MKNNNKTISLNEVLTFFSIILLILYLYGSLFLTNLGTDGICYALIARNLAEGFGSLWAPAYSLTQHTPFYDHPSVGLIIESLFFRVLGDHNYTEHVYAFTVALINLSMLFLFWRNLTLEKEKKLPTFESIWVVIACWFSVPYFVYYYIGGGLEMLANTLIFPAIYLLLLSVNKKHSICKTQTLICISALLIFISLLINGPLTLFPFVFYGLHWMVYKKFKASYYLKLTTFLLVDFIIIATLFFMLFPDAYLNFKGYLHHNVINSLLANRYDATLAGIDRMKIIIEYIPQFKWLYLLSSLVLFIHSKKRKVTLNDVLTNHLFQNNEAALTLLISISATLPIMISSKQSLHYTLQGGFFFLLSFLLFLVPTITMLTSKIVFSMKKARPGLILVLITIICTLISTPKFWVTKANNVYDIITQRLSPVSTRLYLEDTHNIAKSVPPKSIIYFSILTDATNPDPIGNNLMRYYKISLGLKEGAPYSLVLKRDYDYYLKFPLYQKQVNSIIKRNGYERVDIKLNHFYLYKK